MPETSQKLKSLGSYAFDELNKIAVALKVKGIDVIDFGVGDPVDPTPGHVLDAMKNGLDKHASSGYPSYIGMPAYRQAVSEWLKKRFDVSLNPENQVTSTVGSKEAIFNFAQAYVNPGDIVIMPTPGYPPYKTGTIMSGGIPYFYPLTAENHFLPDLEKIPYEILEKAKIFWINYPNNPTTATADLDFMKKVAYIGREHDIVIASDEAYSEMYAKGVKPPVSILEALDGGIDGSNVIVFNSLSKRSNMTGSRIGYAAGDSNIISALRKIKTNIDSGTPNFVQEGAIEALKDETAVESMRYNYDIKRERMLDALKSAGFPEGYAKGTFYIWQPVPKGISEIDAAKKLLSDDVAVVAMPGSWISNEVDGINPGAGYLRFALVPSIAKTEEAAIRIEENLRLFD